MMQDMVHMMFQDRSVAGELLTSLQGIHTDVLQTLTRPEWEYLLGKLFFFLFFFGLVRLGLVRFG